MAGLHGGGEPWKGKTVLQLKFEDSMLGEAESVDSDVVSQRVKLQIAPLKLLVNVQLI
jgi:hypothetical protein